MAKRSSVPGRAGHLATPFDHTLSHRLWRGATMLVAASAAGAVFVGPHADARASETGGPLVAQQPATRMVAGPSTNPGPRGPTASLRDPAPTGVVPQAAPRAPLAGHVAAPDAVTFALPEIIVPGPLVMQAPVRPARVERVRRIAEATTAAEAKPGARLAFDRSLTWAGAGALGIALAGLAMVARRRRAW